MDHIDDHTDDHTNDHFDDPVDVARVAAQAARPLLVALDVDGVLAPIVDRPDDSALLPGVHTALSVLAARTPVIVVSGRSLVDLEGRFGFPPEITVFGSHGLERRGGAAVTLDADEHERLERLDALARSAAIEAGEGAMVERKPASVVLHVRLADSDAARRAIDRLSDAASSVAGATVKPGHAVVELFARPTSKADAVAGARAATDARTVLFAGDDATDEEVFTHLTDNDVGVRVGDGTTLARFRLSSPDDVVAMLECLTRTHC